MSFDQLGDADVMNKYAEFVAWANYAKSVLVQAEIEEEQAEHDLKLVEAHSLIEEWSVTTAKKDTVTAAKARRDLSENVVGARQRLLNARAYRKLIDSVYDRCEKSGAVLSRELSRRIGLKEYKTQRYQP